MFSDCWYLALRVSIIQIRYEFQVLFLFSCLLFILVRVIIAPPAGEDVQPLCQGAYHPVLGDILLLHALSGKDV